MINVKIAKEDFDKMISYAQIAYEKFGTEVSGMLPVINTTDGLWMQTPEILKQECTAATTDLDKEALSEYFTKQTEKHIELIPDKLIHCWWHSHHTMDAFWSGTDDSTINGFAEKGSIFAIVVNNKSEYKITYAERRIVAGVSTIVQSLVDLEIYDTLSDEHEKDIVENIVNGQSAPKLQMAGFRPRRSIYTSRDEAGGTVITKQQSVFDKQTAYEEGIDWDNTEDMFGGMFEDNLEDLEAISIEKTKPKKKKKKWKKDVNLVIEKIEDIAHENVDFDQNDYIASLVEALDHYIYNFNVDGDYSHEHVAKVNGFINEIRTQQELVDSTILQNKDKYHTLSSVEGIKSINDIIIKEEVLDELDYTKISEHIPTEQPLL